jgi:hypothetical protein
MKLMQWALNGNGMIGRASTFHLTGVVLSLPMSTSSSSIDIVLLALKSKNGWLYTSLSIGQIIYLFIYIENLSL